MNATISEARSELSSTAPRIEKVTIDKDKIRDLIGPGGKTIKEITENTNTKIEIDDAGIVSIFATDKKCMEEAVSAVKSICCPPEVGAIYDGVVVKIMDFGAFVSIGNREGLVHISQISEKKVRAVHDVLKEGQNVKVKVLGIDEKNRIKLSMKGL